MKERFERRLFVALAAALVALTLAGVVALRNSVRLRETNRLVTHTYDVLATMEDIVGLLGDAQTSTRGFVISGSEAYLSPYRRARESLDARLVHLRELTADNPQQQNRLGPLRALVAAEMAFRTELVETVRSDGVQAARQLMLSRGTDAMDEIRRRLDEMEASEQALLIARQAETDARDRSSMYLTALLALVSIATFAAGLLIVRHYLEERRRAEDEVNRFFSLSLDMLVVSSQDGYFKRLSPAVTGILGWSVSEMLERPFMELVHPADAAATLGEVERQVKRGESVLHFENRYRHKDGSWRTLAWRSAPGPGGLMFATARDVTEQRRIERMRAEMDQRFRALFESLPGLFAVLQPDFTIVAASDAYLAAAMKERSELLGRNILEALPDNPADASATGVASLRASLERVRESKVPDSMAIQKYDVARPDGVFIERYWSPINTPLLDANGDVEYIVHRVEDVTDFVRRNRAEESGTAPADPVRMEKMAAEVFRSSEAARAANLQLQEANAEMEAFSYSVSHDLRAPLRHIQGYVEMLTRETQGALSERAQRFLRTISEASHEMSVLIDDLLSFSRMARAGMARSEVDLKALAEEVRASLDHEGKGRRIEWRIEALPRVFGDAAMLRQVLANLFQNAIKYTRPKDPAVIELRHTGEEGGQAVFMVRDNGVGFDPQYVHKLFGVFQRLHRADEFEGTGIGLASVRRIVARHGGRTWAEGEPGRGASIFFTIQALPAGEPRKPGEAET